MPKECTCCGNPSRPGNHYCTCCGVAMEKQAPPRAVLAFLSGQRQWAERPISNRVVQIGRGGFSDIVMNDPLVSEKHARVSYSGDSFWIEDLGSRNGTFVNGRRIDKRSVLRDGYLIRVGSSMIRFGQDTDEDNST